MKLSFTFAYLNNRFNVLLSILLEKYGHWIPDRQYLELKFRICMGERLDFQHPMTYNEKLQWIKLFDRNPEYTMMVDKVAAKNYVSTILGGYDHIIPTLGIFEHAEDINFDVLPDQFVLKCSHDSGSRIICLNKNSLKIRSVQKKLNRYLKRNYFYKDREWPYKNVPPQIIAEKYMCDVQSENATPGDFKFYCFDGKVECILVCMDRSTNLSFYYFTRDWQFLRWDVKTQYKQPGFTLPRPENLDEMIALAEKLSSRVRHVRVDLYDIGGKIYFGEYTFCTNSGLDRIITHECDVFLGKLLHL